MKINVIEKIINDNTSAYEITDYVKCCNEFVNSGAVGVGIGNCWALEAQIVYTEDDGFGFDERVEEPIKFCPFCGAKIELTVTGQVDYEPKANELSAKIKQLNELILNEDSIKNREKLEMELKVVREELGALFAQKLHFEEDEE